MTENLPEYNVTPTPMSMIAKAQDNNASIEQMNQLFDLQVRWENRQAEMAFNTALAKFNNSKPTIIKKSTVDFTGQKGRTHYRHANLADITSVISPLLAKAGLSFSFDIKQNGTITVTCNLNHSGGHSQSVTMAAPIDNSGNKNPIQQIGSTVTYLQRYTLMSILGLAAAEDDDANSAVAPVIETLNKDQIGMVNEMIDKNLSEERAEKFLVFLQVSDVSEIPKSKFKFVCQQLDKMKGGATK